MKIIKAGFEILSSTPNLEEIVELAGRTCYKSEDKITEESAGRFINKLHASRHESVLEHGAITVRIVCDRGVSHELVRQRIASFSQESTRYCNYSNDKFDGEITVIDIETGFKIALSSPNGEQVYDEWYEAMSDAERHYLKLKSLGASNNLARSVLPHSLKTEVIVTANPREWLHIFRLRTATTAHPQMEEIMVPLSQKFALHWPNIFKEFR